MRTFLLTFFFLFFVLPLVSAQDLEQLRKAIESNISVITSAITSSDFERAPPSSEIVTAGKAVIEAVAQIYAQPDVGEKDRQWTLQREAAALIVLAYAEPQKYYSRLTLISDELEHRGLSNKIMKLTEKHVLELGSLLATKTGNNGVSIGVGPLADRMVYYAQQNPDQESLLIIERFLQRIRSMANPAQRDRRLAIVAPIFQQYYQSINHTVRALAFQSDIARTTLPGQIMPLMGVDLNGNDFDPASVQNKVVLLQFWGTWCVHCKEEMVNLMALYEKYFDSGFEIIGINTGVKGDNENKVKQFLNVPLPNGKKIPWTILHEGLCERKNKGVSMTKVYGIDELPVMILIGRNGKVLDLHPSPSALDSRIAEATSLVNSVDFTEEEQQQLEAIKRKQQAEIDQQIKSELSSP